MYYSTSVMQYLVAFALMTGSHQLVLAQNNDGGTPCVSGSCSWDMPTSSGQSGTLQIWGPETSISDITKAAGWNITHCDPEAMIQDIQLFCADPNSHCDHLFQGSAVDTIVRLPDECGPMPFARVANLWNNQSNMLGSSAVIARAGDAAYTMKIDTNFSMITPSPNGSVYFHLLALNGGNGQVVNQSSLLDRREFDGSPSHVERASIFTKMLRKLKKLTSFNINISKNLQLFNFSGNHTLFDMGIGCPGSPSPFTAAASVDFSGVIETGISVGAVAHGTIIPPEISDLGVAVGLNGNIDALFDVSINLTGIISTQDVPFFQVGVPGLDIPGILTVGPSFVIKGRIDGVFTLSDLLAQVHIIHNFNDVVGTYPESEDTGGSFSRGTCKLDVSTGPNITQVGASVGIIVHLMPEVDLGISAFADMVDGKIYMKLDTTAGVVLSATNGDPQVCLDFDTGLALDFGWKGDLGSYNVNTTYILFQRDWTLWKKCFELPHSHSARDYVFRDDDDDDESNFGWPHAKRAPAPGCPLTLSGSMDKVASFAVA